MVPHGHQESWSDPVTGQTVADVLASKHLLHRFPLLPLSPLTPLHLISLIWISLLIPLNMLPVGSMVPQVLEVPMLMPSPIGSLALVKPARSCTLLWHALLAGWPMISLPGMPTYQALMTGHLLAPDKNPGVWPIGIGDTWCWVLAKSILQVASPAATKACDAGQLCAGLSAGIEGAIHLMKTGDFCSLMHIMLSMSSIRQWVVQHKWPSGAQFCFNTYHHWSTLVIHHCNGTSHYLYSQEGVTQGDPVAMVAYGLSTISLIESRIPQAFASLVC